MRERPIIFSGGMVQAILSGRKTQTRRVVKTPAKHKEFYLNGQGRWTNSRTGEYHEIAYGVELNNNGEAFFLVAGDMGFDGPIKCPYGQEGDCLWVRETCATDLKGFIYRADGCWEDNKSITWKPSIFMPRKASRITLEVVSVRVERLQDISEEDAIAEGIDQPEENEASDWQIQPKLWRDYLCDESSCVSAGQSFQTLWDSINSDRGYGWDTNPWVWRIEFKRVEG